MKSIYKFIEKITTDYNRLGVQLVLGGIKAITEFSTNSDLSKFNFDEFHALKGQDKSNPDTYWIFINYSEKNKKPEYLIFLINRPLCLILNEQFNYQHPFEDSKNLSYIEQMLVSQTWGHHIELFGLAFGFPRSCTIRFNEEMTKGLRSDRMLDFFLESDKERLGFISYPECIDESNEVLEKWWNYLDNQHVTLGGKNKKKPSLRQVF